MAVELKDLTKRSENYSQWYNELVVKADLAEQSAVRGCMVIKPYGYAIWDEEFRQRVIRHQERRGPEWTNIEEEKELSRHRLEGRVVLIDCITLWCTNFFFDLHSDTDRALAAVKAEFDRFTAQDATFIFVTNEIGMGGTSENELQRKFTDMQGWMNQYVAARADEVILMVSGIPLTVKNTHS